MNARILFLCIISFFISCEESDDFDFLKNPDCKHYIFLGHIYHSPNRIDPGVEKLHLSIYNQIWLGGDLCSETTREYSTILYLNRIFNLASDFTHWTLGNHDIRNGNHEWITTATGKDFYYAQSFQSFTLFNLNTSLINMNRFDLINNQYELLKNVCDTIRRSKYLIVIMHHVVWQNVSDEFDTDEFANSSYSQWFAHFQPEQTFEEAMYPLLVGVEKKGIDVICISGDVGQKDQKYFEFETKEGVVFLASGINNSTESDPEKRAKLPKDKVLILTHNIKTGEISWNFYNLDDIL